jgi:hypothetical protein
MSRATTSSRQDRKATTRRQNATARINSWRQLARSLIKLQGTAAWSARGEECCFSSCLPAIDRYEWSTHLETRLLMERVLLERFCQQAPEYASPVERRFLVSGSLLHSSMIARHYGVPTRLVDWTDSLWIAAYFAAQPARSGQQPDGRVLVFDRHHLQRANEAENKRIGRLSLPGSSRSHPINEVMPSELWRQPYHNDNGTETAALFELEVIRSRLGAAKDFVLPFYCTSSKFSRLIVQRGSFTFTYTPVTDHWAAITGTLDRHRSLGDGYKMWVIERDAKPDILQGLAEMGVHAASVFPGLDGIGRHLSEFAQFGDRDVALRALLDLSLERRPGKNEEAMGDKPDGDS